MDLSYTTIPNFDGSIVRIYREPLYEGHLERYEDGVKNSYVHGQLFLDGVSNIYFIYYATCIAW